MNAVIFQHMESNPPGKFLQILQAQDVACRIIRTASESIKDFDALAPDLVMIMGGSPGVYQAQDYPFLKEEIMILEKRLAADEPTLGICLGAQLMAAALGEKVFKGPQGPEVGWFDLTLTPSGLGSPVRAYAGRKIMQWHGDTFDLPGDAVLLASSAAYTNQIFSHGRHAIAFQGHVEVTDAILNDWFVEDAGKFVGRSEELQIIRSDTKRNIEAMNRATDIFLKEWLLQVMPQQENAHA